MVNYMTMIVVNIFEAKAKLSEFLELAAKGERVLICKRNRPIAELRAVEATRTEPRPIGLARGQVELTDAFFEPLPEEIVDGFDGVEAKPRGLRVAEGRPGERYAGSKPRRRGRKR
jgi:prevent-host-death family protein